MYDTDVLVVGAGPTGLTLAASLVDARHRRDHRRRAVRRAPTPPAPPA